MTITVTCLLLITVIGIAWKTAKDIDELFTKYGKLDYKIEKLKKEKK